MKASVFAWAIALGAISASAAPAALAQQAVAAPSEDARLTAFFDREFEQELLMRPQLATRLGLKTGMDRLDDISSAGELKRLQWRRGSVARMKAQFDRAKLSSEAQASYDMWAMELERAELAYRYRIYAPPLYSFLDSVHTDLPGFLVNTHPVSDAADMRAYSARLRALSGVLDTAVTETRASAAKGIRPPRFQYESILSGSRQLITGAPFDHGADSPLWADAQAKVRKLREGGKVSPAEAEALLTEARAAVLGVRPAYQRVIAWAEGDIAKAKSDRVGAGSLPGGAAWYAAALKLQTTTDLTPEQVHLLGLKEVARIRGDQDALARAAGFADAAAFVADRERRFPPTPWTDASRDEYLRAANASIAAAREKLPAYFGLLPAHRVEVVREPSFSEVAGGAAHAAPPTPDGARPGRVYVHLLGTTEDPAAIPDLMCHEGIPGHVLQGDIQVRQTGSPMFRRGYRYVAYSEGWALYAEALCKEMGVYTEPAADFARLNGELFRAARLVVDTGLHAKGWSDAEAVDYLIKSGGQTPAMARSEVKRYITWPGQATGYKIGMVRIMELRARAERELGPKFDLKGFHDLVVGGGSMPLAVLERRVDAWIATRR